MNNYNESINKPTINGKELIGNVNLSLLPAVTAEDVGKVPIVGEDGSWTVGTVSGGGSGLYGDTLRFNTTVQEV